MTDDTTSEFASDITRRLEAIIHPLVREEEEAFLARCRREGAGLAIIDVPLLLETGDKLLASDPSPALTNRLAGARGNEIACAFEIRFDSWRK